MIALLLNTHSIPSITSSNDTRHALKILAHTELTQKLAVHAPRTHFMSHAPVSVAGCARGFCLRFHTGERDKGSGDAEVPLRPDPKLSSRRETLLTLMRARWAQRTGSGVERILSCCRACVAMRL